MQLSRRIILPVLMLALVACAAPAFARITLDPKGRAQVVPIGRETASKDYFLVGESGLIVPVTGPGKITGYAKVHFAPGDTLDKAAELRFSGVPGLPAAQSLTFGPPSRGTYAKARDGMPSGSERVTLDIPAGEHELRIDGGVAGGGELFLLLYYKGPKQPAFERQFRHTEKPKPKTKPKKRKIKLLGFTLTASSSLDFTYNDNAFAYSDPIIGLYHRRPYDEKFQHVNRIDDGIISPGLSLTGTRKFFDIGSTKVTLKFARDQYWHNPKLSNEEYRVAVRQNTGSGKSLEVYYSYSPSKYLRQLNGRESFGSYHDPYLSYEFRLARNKFVATWRQKLRKDLNFRFVLTRKLYYYNTPHQDNDLKSWSYQFVGDWKINKAFRLRADYTFSDNLGLGVDYEPPAWLSTPAGVGSSLLDTPYSDGTNKGNRYNVELRWTPPFKSIKKVTSYVALRAQYGVDYFSAEDAPTIDWDSYHVGRQDNYYTYQIKGARKMPFYPKVSTSFGFGYAERSLDSPSWGDIKEDKNWISRTYWLGFSYKLF